MTIKNGDKSAMPTHDVYQDCGIDGNSGPYLTQTTSYGLTKREMMAMHIASGLISDPQVRTGEVVATAVKVADALLAELERANG